MSTFHGFALQGIDGQPLPLSRYRGRPVLLVNVASQCGLTPQYAGLQALHSEYGPRGLVVLGLPCNQFGAQEPGSEAEILNFCTRRYGVEFPLSAKIEVNGPGRHPLYAWLAGPESPYPGDIGWNFEKFLVDGEGRLIARFGPRISPTEPHLRQAIEQALQNAAAA